MFLLALQHWYVTVWIKPLNCSTFLIQSGIHIGNCFLSWTIRISRWLWETAMPSPQTSENWQPISLSHFLSWISVIWCKPRWRDWRWKDVSAQKNVQPWYLIVALLCRLFCYEKKVKQNFYKEVLICQGKTIIRTTKNFQRRRLTSL